MAKRSRVRYKTRVKRVYSRARGGGGKYKPIIDGLLAGAGATLIKRFINLPFADDLALVGVGIFRHNPTLTTIGGIGLAGDLLGTVGFGSNNNGGYIA